MRRSTTTKTGLSKAMQRKYAGQHAAAADVGSRERVIAHAASLEELMDVVEARNLDPSTFYVTWFPPVGVPLIF
jgi:hypothetical protein